MKELISPWRPWGYAAERVDPALPVNSRPGRVISPFIHCMVWRMEGLKVDNIKPQCFRLQNLIMDRPQKMVKFLEDHCVDRVSDVPFFAQQQMPMIRKVQTTVKIHTVFNFSLCLSTTSWADFDRVAEHDVVPTRSTTAQHDYQSIEVPQTCQQGLECSGQALSLTIESSSVRSTSLFRQRATSTSTRWTTWKSTVRSLETPNTSTRRSTWPAQRTWKV